MRTATYAATMAMVLMVFTVRASHQSIIAAAMDHAPVSPVITVAHSISAHNMSAAAAAGTASVGSR
jgi:hypothetical protein